MKPIRTRMFPTVLSWTVLALLAGRGPIWGQPAAPPSTGGGWRRFGDAPQAQPASRQPRAHGARRSPKTPPPAADPPPRAAARSSRTNCPPELTIKPGTFVSIRVNEMLSTDRNRAGDTFSGVLEQPLVVDGIVVAERGQTVYGRVAEAEKARTTAPSRLALELTELSLADGAQTPVRS